MGDEDEIKVIDLDTSDLNSVNPNDEALAIMESSQSILIAGTSSGTSCSSSKSSATPSCSCAVSPACS